MSGDEGAAFMAALSAHDASDGAMEGLGIYRAGTVDGLLGILDGVLHAVSNAYSSPLCRLEPDGTLTRVFRVQRHGQASDHGERRTVEHGVPRAGERLRHIIERRLLPAGGAYASFSVVFRPKAGITVCMEIGVEPNNDEKDGNDEEVLQN